MNRDRIIRIYKMDRITAVVFRTSSHAVLTIPGARYSRTDEIL